jgi:hypothetical protein
MSLFSIFHYLTLQFETMPATFRPGTITQPATLPTPPTVPVQSPPEEEFRATVE